MSRAVNMLNWNQSTATVYASLLSDEQLFKTAAQAAAAVPGYKRAGIHRRIAHVRRVVSKQMKPANTNPVVSQVFDGFFENVDWSSLTRRLIGQGKVDRIIYGALTNHRGE